MNFSPGQVHPCFGETKKWQCKVLGVKEFLPLFIPNGGRSSTRIPFASEQVCMQPRGLSIPTAISVSALPALQPLVACSCAARALSLYIESIIAHCPHVCSRQADQGQVGILDIRIFIFSTFLKHYLPLTLCFGLCSPTQQSCLPSDMPNSQPSCQQMALCLPCLSSNPKGTLTTCIYPL